MKQKKSKTKIEKKSMIKDKGFKPLTIGKAWVLMVLIILIGISVVVVLNTHNTNPPRVTRECCNEFCGQGSMECHRYTAEYIMCRYPENITTQGVTPVLDFWIYNRTAVCGGDKDGMSTTQI